MRTPGIVSLAAAVFACGTAVAQVAAPNAAIGEAPGNAATEDFSKLDRNRDGAIDGIEAQRDKTVKARFDQLDAEKDGRLTPAEFSVMEADIPDHSTRP
jgi:hypothetical protein